MAAKKKSKSKSAEEALGIAQAKAENTFSADSAGTPKEVGPYQVFPLTPARKILLGRGMQYVVDEGHGETYRIASILFPLTLSTPEQVDTHNKMGRRFFEDALYAFTLDFIKNFESDSQQRAVDSLINTIIKSQTDTAASPIEGSGGIEGN